ncbi:MAG TPA: IS200/IS605 family transposase [Planctomycetota bacterium]|nr:IS200/IS605 family transposase [Planctomycetota bacterium]
MSQSLSKILLHAVFSTKHRAPSITPEIEPRLHAYMAGILENLESHAIRIGGVVDHVHVLFRLSKNRSVSDVLGKLKANSSSWMKDQGRIHAGFHWQNGYGNFSIGESAIDGVVQYIDNQKERHKTMTFEEELKRLLDLYHMEYDERYLRD